jgi:hypothetical protein
MTEASDEKLTARVLELRRAELLEAVLALGDELGVESASDAVSSEFVAEIERQPFAAVEDVEELARTALLAAALDPQCAEQVREIVERAGQKAFIFGGAEIVVAGALAISLIQVVLSKGKTGEEETLEISVDAQGIRHIRHRRKTIYGLNARVGKLLSSLVPHAGG